MYTIIEQMDLQAGIEKAEKVMRKSKKPILESVLLSAYDGKITITANNLESAIIIDVDGNIQESGSILIDKSNFKLIKKLSGRLHITDDAGTVKIKGNRELKFKQGNIENYPQVKNQVNNEAFLITENEFKNSLKIKIFASTEEYRLQIASCCITGNRIAATDGYRFAKIDLNIDNKCNHDIIIPIYAIMELDKILDKKSVKELKFEYYSELIGNKEELKYLRITGQEMGMQWQYITRLIGGEYIKIDQIIPTEFKLNININKDKLKESTEFSQEILSEKQPIIFDITKEFKVSGTGKDKEFSEIIHNDLNIAESDYMKIGYNPKYLIDVFKTLPDDRIKLSFVGGANKPMIITGNKTNNETYMVLPVRIAS